MSNKQLKSRKSGLLTISSEKDSQKQAAEGKAAKRNLFILGILVALTLSVAAANNWRQAPLNAPTSPLAARSAGAPALMTTPPPMPAVQPNKEFVYAGNSLVSTVEPFREPPVDLAIWRPSNGVWYVLNSATQQATVQQWGQTGDIPAPGDFDGDGKTDFCVFRESSGTWYIIYSSTGAPQYEFLAGTGDIPAIADYDGDGKSDIAVWRPSTHTWYVKRSSDNITVTSTFSSTGDTPVPADYDGDGKADYAIWRDSTYTFWVLNSSDNSTGAYSIGQSGDEPVVGDYDGDGKTDFAVRRPSDNIWRIRYSSDGSLPTPVNWGIAGDIAVPGRYNDAGDQDAKTDIAIFRPSTGDWYIRRSSDGSLRGQHFGQNGDTPLPANWRR